MGEFVTQHPGVALTLLVYVVGAVGAFMVLRDRQSSFEKHCGEKFGQLSDELKGLNTRLDDKLDPLVAFMHQTIGERRAQDDQGHGRRTGRRWNDDHKIDEVG